jgi:hypothetical protein
MSRTELSRAPVGLTKNTEHGQLFDLLKRFEGLREQAFILTDKARKAAYNILGPIPEASATGVEKVPSSGFVQDMDVVATGIENCLSELHAQLDRINEALI